MRLTALRRQMAEEFGTVRAETLAAAHVFAQLEGRTVDEALDAGVPPKAIWRAVCEALEVPAERR
ncbi:MAG: DUF3046 domain-containing protein [Sciscionella sp.]